MENNVIRESNSSQATSSSPCKYKGVRFRKWGKYVSEIRLPNSRERIWLGSYDSAVKAARAFDAAQICLRGPSANFNFPDNLPDIPGGSSLTPSQIQVEAAKFAHSWSDPDNPVSNNYPGAEVNSTVADAPSNSSNQAGVEKSLLDEFRTMSWESERVSEYGYFQGFDDFENELFLHGPNYVNEETSDESFTTHASFLWNF